MAICVVSHPNQGELIKTLDSSTVMWALSLNLLVFVLMLNVEPSVSFCTTSVSVHDLACHMHWSCSDVTASTWNFTVQAKTQGEEWENVPHCVQISSNSCDLSQVFNDLDLYKFVRLELNQGHGKINWTSQEPCEPINNANASFSPPSLSLSLTDEGLWVKVVLPCAPETVCQAIYQDYEGEDDEEKNSEVTQNCCRVSDFLTLSSTVTLESTHINYTKICHEVTEDNPCKVAIFELTPGQKYCAVARFASSSLSKPQCIHIPLQENPNLFALALCGIFIAVLLIVGFVLRRWCSWCSTDLRLPKSLMSLQDLDQDDTIVDEPIQAFTDEEETFVHLSIISLNKTLPSDPQSAYPHLQNLGVKYYTTTILHDQVCDKNEDTDYHSRDIETDGVVSPAFYQWPRWSSLPALRTGMVCLLGNVFPSEGLGIPLSSVRIAGVQTAKLDSDSSFKVLPTLYSDWE